MGRITKRVVEAAPAEAKDYFIWDDELPGFGVRIFASGKRSYLIQYRAQTLQRPGPFSAAQCLVLRPNDALLSSDRIDGRWPVAAVPLLEPSFEKRPSHTGHHLFYFIEH